MGGISSALAGLASKGLQKAGRAIAGKFRGGKGASNMDWDNSARTQPTSGTKPDGGKPEPSTSGGDGGKPQGKSPQPKSTALLSPPPEPIRGSRKKGGPIKKAGLYRLHAGEYVVPAKGRTGNKKTAHKRTITKA